jgi:hypothetical protein
MDSKLSNGLSMTYATAAPATSGAQPGSPVRFYSSFAVLVASRLLVEFSNFCSYLIDSIIIRHGEQAADLHLACMSELHYEHDAALETR